MESCQRGGSGRYGSPRFSHRHASRLSRRVVSIVFTAEALRHLVAECGASQIMIGTDYPYPWTSTAVEHVLATPSLSDGERAAILGDNARKLLRIPA